MGRETKNEQNELYREFSRQRFNKYRHQFPKMKQSDIVARIIKEWEATDEKDIKKIAEDLHTSKPAIHAPEQVTIVQPDSASVKSHPDDSDFNRGEQQAKSVGDSESQKAKPLKTKPIAKKTEYLKFFSQCYARLSARHPRWKPVQITTIIKLQWRRKKMEDKRKSSPSRLERPHKPVSGPVAFHKSLKTKLTPIELRTRWKRLPVEAKHQWRKIGLGKSAFETKGREFLIKSTPDHHETFSFLRKTIS